jgi:signal transduction histidine kinase
MLKKLTEWLTRLDPPPAEMARKLSTLEQIEQENIRLKNEARRYANLVNASPNLIWMRDDTMKIVYCNLAFAEVAEETTDAVVSLGEFELFKGHDQMARTAWESAKEQFDRRHVVVNGERRLYAVREVPFKKEGLITGYGVNITETEAAQDEIQRHVSALRDLLESSTSAMAIYGRDQKLKFFNFAFVALWKLDESWLNTEPSYGEVLEALREKRKLPEQANFKAFKTQQQKLFTTLIAPEEEFFYLPDGKTLRVVAIPHALGGILFAYEDVTDRLALERSYNTLIAVQRETLDNLHEGIVVFSESGRLQICNPQFNKLWRLPQEFTSSEPHLRDVLGRCQDLFRTDDWPRYLDNLTARFQQRQFFALRFERTDGSVVDCSCVPLPDGATLLSFLDVTDSTLVERSLRDRAEALEAADRLKTEFLANMSYELRSPLTSISGFAEMLKREYAGKLNESQQEYVEGIYKSSQQLGSLITDIIDLATIEAGYLKLDISRFDIRAAIDSAVALLSEQLKAQKVKIAVVLPKGTTIMEADEVRVKQIVINLVTNAVKITKARAAITIEVSESAQGDIRLTVRDDGPGLDATRRSHLFDPFFRGISGQGSDAALGLSLVKRFVELHGGKVEVESEEGRGTAITCIFPKPSAHVAI